MPSVIYGGTLALMVAFSVAVVLLVPPEGPRNSVLARGYGHATFWYLAVVVISTPWAFFHKGTALAKPMRWRREIGLATCIPAAFHLVLVLMSTPRIRRLEFDLSDISGSIGATIVTVLAITSVPKIRKRMGSKLWKRVHTFVVFAFAAGVFAAMAAEGSELLQWLTGVIALVVVGYRAAYLKARWRQTVSRGASARPP